jgi:hypothetical protein
MAGATEAAARESLILKGEIKRYAESNPEQETAGQSRSRTMFDNPGFDRAFSFLNVDGRHFIGPACGLLPIATIQDLHKRHRISNR